MDKKELKKLFLSPDEAEVSNRRVHWSHEDVLSLVAKVKVHWDEFSSGIRKKKFIWKDIATELGRNGLLVTGDECNRKWRNLKIRYMAVLEKQMTGEKSAHRIDYFEGMHAILRDDPVTRAYLENRNLHQQSNKNLAGHISRKEEELGNITDDALEWTDRAVQLILDLLLEFKDWFTDREADWDDTTIWETISEQMKLEGHQVSSEHCCQKWASLAQEFQQHKSEAEVTGSLPLWPYYTRVRHVLTEVGAPSKTTGSGGNKSKKQGIKRARGDSVKARGDSVKARVTRTFKQESLDPLEDNTDEPSEAVTEILEPDIHRELSATGRTNANVSNGSFIQPGQVQRICQLLENIEDSMHICQRLDRLEAQLDIFGEQKRAQQQTNTLLTQVLSEVSSLRHLLATHPAHKPATQDPTDLASGITIVVPQSQNLK